jgi:RimJ/RimL family protein N-acetyltransferase
MDAAANLPLALDVVMGAAAPHLAAVRARAAEAGDRIRIHTGVAEIGTLMVEADIAVGAAGMSAWERCCLGLPSLVLVAADNQRPGATFLAERQAALVIDGGGAPTVGAIADGLRRLVENAPLRLDMARRAAALSDGRGVLRAMLGLVAPVPVQNGNLVELRLAEPDDAMLMYEWQAAPETRRYARQPAIPTLEEHLDWFERTLRNPHRLLTLIHHGGEPAGVLRFDQLDERPSFEISIAIAPARHGTGIGAAALALGQRLMSGARLIAEVHPANIASRRLFQRADFHGVGPRHFEWTAPASSQDAASLPLFDRALS